ncbi:hypothetical protein C8R45DRAFT_918040 [Mycena sanguinolenta]|nr:hypothetical protein C8R45DRAFT_918040 [Mycena sanguinolenta]
MRLSFGLGSISVLRGRSSSVFTALGVVLSCVAFVASQNAASATDTVPFTDVFPTSTPDDGTVTFDDEFDDDMGTMEANTTSTLPDGTDPDTTAFGEVFIYSPNENAVSSVDTLDTDWVIPADVCDATSSDLLLLCAQRFHLRACHDRGAENTIVKMPASCGAGPYARVASPNIHPTPSALGLSAEQLAQKPANEAVYVLSFDYGVRFVQLYLPWSNPASDFSVIPDANGPILMRADISDIPGYWDEIVDAPDDTRRKRRRVLVLSILHSVHAPRDLEPRWSGSFEEWLAKMNDIQKSATASRTFNWRDTWVIFEAQVTCPASGLTAAIDAGVTGTASVKTQYGFYVEATVVPPAINSAYVFASATPTVKALFTLTGGGSVTYTSEKVTFATFGFPGLSVPGLITVGPSLVLQGYIAGKLSLAGVLSTSVSRTFPTVTFSLGNSSADFFSVNVSPSASDQGTEVVAGYNVELSGNMSIHIVPSFELGLSVLNGVVLDAQVGVCRGRFVWRHAYQWIRVKHRGASILYRRRFQIRNHSPHSHKFSDGGLKGDVLFWKTGNLTHNFFKAQDEIFGQPRILFLLACVDSGSIRRGSDIRRRRGSNNTDKTIDAAVWRHGLYGRGRCCLADSGKRNLSGYIQVAGSGQASGTLVDNICPYTPFFPFGDPALGASVEARHLETASNKGQARDLEYIS